MQTKKVNHDCGLTANRAGPTTSGAIEDEFVKEVRRRFRRLRGLIRQTVGYENDALGLTSGDGGLFTDNAEPRERFEYTTRPELVNQFIRWLERAIDEEILEPPEQGESLEQHWTAAFIQNAYVNGFNQGTGLLFQQGASVENPANSELLSRPISQRSLQTLYTRTYEDLKDITDDMADVIRDELTEGFARGENPRKMANRLTKEIRDMQHSRAETLARSETMNAHSDGSLTRYESAGVGVVGHTTWQDAADARVCPFCRRLDGVALTLDEARSATVQWRGKVYRLMSPAHANGRCLHLPDVGATPPTTTLQDRLDEHFNGITVLTGG